MKILLITKASENGHLDIIKYLYEAYLSEVDDNAIVNASYSGNLELVKYLYETCYAKGTKHALLSARTEEIKKISKF